MCSDRRTKSIRLISHPLVAFAITFVIALVIALVNAGGILHPSQAQIAVEDTLSEDALNVGRIRWRGIGLPFEKLVNIEEALVGEVVGRAVLDRQTLADVRTAFISAWGSNYEGCFIQLTAQRFVVLPSPELDTASVRPVQFDIAVEGQIIQLDARADDGLVLRQQGLQSIAGNRLMYILYTGQQTFPIDAAIARLLSNAPIEDIRTRVTFANNTSMDYDVESETVSRWRGAYSFNTDCPAPNASQSPDQPSSSPQSHASDDSAEQTDPSSPPILEIQDSFDPDRPTLPNVDVFLNIHPFQGTAGQTITMTMTSAEVDASVTLVTPANQVLAQNVFVQNTALANNDHRVQIVVELPQTGVYTVVVSSLDASTMGSYNLTIR